MKVNDVYTYLEQIAPFKYQESYDNSGVLIGSGNTPVKKICICLDITLAVIEEAVQKGANLIISHHPVIFKPLNSIKSQTPVHELIRNDICAICTHTNFDAAFMSNIMIDMLGFPHSLETIEGIGSEGAGYGKITNLPEFISPSELAFKCKKAFKSPYVRYVSGGKFVSRVGVCSGSAGHLFDLAMEKKCHAFITGEVKHSLMVQAKNLGVTLIEAGHYHTESVFCMFLKNELNGCFSEADIFVANQSIDFCEYI